MSRFAVVDIGTVSVLLLVGEVGPGDSFSVVEDRAAITRLGQGIVESGRLSPAAVSRTVAQIDRYAQLWKKLGVVEVVAIGTEALRRAENAEPFLRIARETIGADITIITGEEEARYTMLSIVQDRALCFAAETLLVVDIGGGSTELILRRRGGALQFLSCSFGASTLEEKFFQTDPVRENDLDRLSTFLKGEMDKLPDFGQSYPMVGVGGTVTTLAAMAWKMERFQEKTIHGVRLSVDELFRQVGLLKSMTIDERSRLPGLPPARAGIILPGAIIILSLLARYRQDSLFVSTRGVRYGVFFDKFLRASHEKK